MATEFYSTSWGSVRLWMSSVSTVAGRDLVIHELSAGDVPVVQDHGASTRRVRVELLFDEMRFETTTPMQRLIAFHELTKKGEPQILSHPVEGSFLARVEAFTYEVSDNGTISGSCEFIQVAEVEAVSPAGTGTSAHAGAGAVAASSDSADAELAASNLSSDTPAAAKAMTQGWADADELAARDVLIGAARMSDEIGVSIVDLGLEVDLNLWGAFKAHILLGDRVRAAADAATSEVAKVFTIRIEKSLALRPLLARVYGAREAADRYRQVIGLNDISTPGWIPAGSELILPLPTTTTRVG